MRINPAQDFYPFIKDIHTVVLNGIIILNVLVKYSILVNIGLVILVTKLNFVTGKRDNPILRESGIRSTGFSKYYENISAKYLCKPKTSL